MKHLIPCLTASLLLIMGMAPDAQATCSFICEGALIDSACDAILPAVGDDAAVWSDATRAPLFSVACQVQCCAPGMCSDPTPESIMAANLTLMDVKGTDLMGTFQEERSPLCEGKQVFSLQSTLAQNAVYDVVHQGQILSRFQYDPVSIVDPDMGADMDVADMTADEDMAMDQEDMGSVSVDMATDEDMAVDSTDMDHSGAADMGSQSSPDMPQGWLDMYNDSTDTNGSLAELGDDIREENAEEDGGCQTASGHTPAGQAPLALLTLGLLGGLRRARKK
jgi:MYXO-CTERM domain-containing protein